MTAPEAPSARGRLRRQQQDPRRPSADARGHGQDRHPPARGPLPAPAAVDHRARRACRRVAGDCDPVLPCDRLHRLPRTASGCRGRAGPAERRRDLGRRHRTRLPPGGHRHRGDAHAGERAHRGAHLHLGSAGPRARRPGRGRHRPQLPRRHLRHRRQRRHGGRAAGPALPDRDQRARLERGPRRPHQRRPPRRLERRDRLLQHRPHRGDHRDAGPGEVLGCLRGRGHQRPQLPDGTGRRRPPDQLRAGRVPPARRPVGQARPALRDRPALPVAAQRDFSRTTSLLAASAAAVAPHRRPLRTPPATDIGLLERNLHP